MARILILISALLLASYLAACGPVPQPESGQQTEVPSPVPQPTFTPTPLPTEEPAVSPGELDAPLESDTQPQAAALAIEDLAGRLGVPAEDVMVVSVASREWPDASLGCPAPGMGYAQVLTEGMQVVLEVDGETYAYHGRSPEDLFLCGPEGPMPPGEPLPPAQSGTDKDSLTAATAAVVADLKEMLGTAAAEVEIVSVEAVQWPDSALGCAQPGQRVMEVISPGYRVQVAAGQGIYEYHTDNQGNFILCEKWER